MFGMSVFQSVLERLKTEEESEFDEVEARLATPRAPIFAGAFAVESAGL